MPAKYESIKAAVIDLLKKAGWCSLTTDMWTGCHSHSYIAVTAHTISTEWEMKSYHLATREVIDAHTAETLSQELSDVIIEWEIDGKIFGITTDNAKNVTNAVVTLDYTHFGCIGHTPQLSISKGTQLGFIIRVLGRVRKLIEHFHRSTNTQYGLWKKQELLGIPEHAMIKQCETRWNSTFAMLERVIKQQQAICAVLLESQDRILCNLLPWKRTDYN